MVLVSIGGQHAEECELIHSYLHVLNFTPSGSRMVLLIVMETISLSSAIAKSLYIVSIIHILYNKHYFVHVSMLLLRQSTVLELQKN